MPPIRGPSPAAMVKYLKITPAAAKEIKALMLRGGGVRAVLQSASRAMGGFGYESAWPEYPRFSYVNVGDMYALTLYYTGNSFQIGTVGDWIERHRPVAHDGSNPRDPKWWREDPNWLGGKRPVRRRCR